MTETVKQTINLLYSELDALGSPLASAPIYSNIYMLFRSIAAVIGRVDLDIKETRDKFYLSTSFGEDLDALAGNFGLSRVLGTKAKGKVLAKGITSTIESGTVLSTSDQSLQYIIENDSYITTSFRAISVEANDIGTKYNISAGTKLYSLIYPNVEFVVGSAVDPITNQFSTSILGGLEAESDLLFKQRVSSYITNLSFSTNNGILSNIRALTNKRVYIKQHTPVTGYITVYVDTESQRELDAISELVNNIKAAGVSYLVKKAKTKDVSLIVNASVIGSEFTVETTNQLKRPVFTYINNLDIGSSLSPSTIASLILSNSSVKTVDVISPIEIITATQEEVISVISFDININIV